jgi:hypothetical protein
VPPKRPCPDGERWCPDCARERGGSGCTPLTEFGANKKFCRRHLQARKIASRAKMLATSEEARRKKRAADKRYRDRHVVERADYLKGWKKRNPEKVAAWYARWVKANPEKRQASRDAWRNRQTLRADRYRFKTDYAPRPEYDPRDE